MQLAFFFLNAVFCALNIGMYAWNDNPWNLGAAVLSGSVALLHLALVVTDR